LQHFYGVGDGVNVGCGFIVGEAPHPAKPAPAF